MTNTQLFVIFTILIMIAVASIFYLTVFKIPEFQKHIVDLETLNNKLLKEKEQLSSSLDQQYQSIIKEINSQWKKDLDELATLRENYDKLVKNNKTNNINITDIEKLQILNTIIENTRVLVHKYSVALLNKPFTVSISSISKYKKELTEDIYKITYYDTPMGIYTINKDIYNFLINTVNTINAMYQLKKSKK